jgi:hypothetical protein
MFSKALIWPASLGWHLWRIATVRPAFDKLSDTARVVWSFIGIYFAAGVLRWYALTPETFADQKIFPVLIKLVVHLFVVLALFERRNRSSALSASVLGVSVVVDIVVCALYLVGAIDSVSTHLVDAGAEIALSLAMLVQFNRQPEAVRMHGYLRPRPLK